MLVQADKGGAGSAGGAGLCGEAGWPVSRPGELPFILRYTFDTICCQYYFSWASAILDPLLTSEVAGSITPA